ncbi:MAG: DUF2062 domain-containing protein [Deltaproteobacteria bacterium]|nr:DUF2062 domain-containing protein [Deltaproteobacteria bacterium]
MANLLQNIRDEAGGFRDAFAAAPEPPLGWDVFGGRRALHKLGWLLLREHTAPRELALAVLVGVMIGATPFYLFHTALVLLLAFAFRLNKLAVWIASNVSFPVVAPFLTFASVQVGHLILEGGWLPLTLAGVRELYATRGPVGFGVDLWLAWLVGCVPVGLALGSLFASITYGVARSRRSE